MSALITYKLKPRINPVYSSPFPLKRGTFVLFALFVFTRRIPYSPVPSRASVEHSCYSRFSCSQEESRVHKKNPVSSSPFPRKRGTFVLFALFVFTRKISCSQEESRVLQSLPAQAWNIRVIRVFRVHKKYLVFTRRIPYPPVPSRASVENSCYSRYSCSQEKSRVHKKIIRVPIRMQK